MAKILTEPNEAHAKDCLWDSIKPAFQKLTDRSRAPRHTSLLSRGLWAPFQLRALRSSEAARRVRKWDTVRSAPYLFRRHSVMCTPPPPSWGSVSRARPWQRRPHPVTLSALLSAHSHQNVTSRRTLPVLVYQSIPAPDSVPEPGRYSSS